MEDPYHLELLGYVVAVCCAMGLICTGGCIIFAGMPLLAGLLTMVGTGGIALTSFYNSNKIREKKLQLKSKIKDLESYLSKLKLCKEDLGK